MIGFAPVTALVSGVIWASLRRTSPSPGAAPSPARSHWPVFEQISGYCQPSSPNVLQYCILCSSNSVAPILGLPYERDHG